VNIIGTTPESIDLAEDRKRFGKLLEELDIPQAPGAMVASVEEAVEAAKKIGFPVLVRPSYVLGGRAMVIAYDEDTIQQYMKQAVEYSQDRPILIDKFLEDAIEVDVDALSDGEDVVIGGIMQHIEEAGIHSGDSSCVLPAVDIPQSRCSKRMRDYTFKLGARLKVIGLMNVQFAIPRKSAECGNGDHEQGLRARSEPARLAHRALRFQSHGRAHGQNCRPPDDRAQAARVPSRKRRARHGPRHRPLLLREIAGLPLVEISRSRHRPRPRNASTGEVMGIADNFGEAFAKAQIAAGQKLPIKGTVFISVTDHDKPQVADVARRFVDMGFKLVATHGTADILEEAPA
jgi:carbamoyl-phosphate synthase large subunit